MRKAKRSFIRANTIVAASVIAACIMRLMVKTGFDFAPLSYVRSAIYIGLFSAWGVSVQHRVIHAQVRRVLSAIAALMVFWLTERSVKYFVELNTDVLRYLWYAFYLPMLFIPLLAFTLSMSLGKPEGFRLPRWRIIPYCITAALLLFVMTNDLHQLVFAFPDTSAVWSDHDYSYAPGYFAVIGWEALCVVCSLVMMLIKCRIPGSRKVLLLPFVPIAIIAVYSFFYVIHADWLFYIAGDITVVFCLLYMATFECCIQCRLIQTNTHYGDLLNASSVRIQITDGDYDTILSSKVAEPYPRQTLCRTEAEPVIMPGGVRLSSVPIKCGHVVWQEDVSELLGIQAELEEKKRDLIDESEVLRENYLTEKRISKLAEENRLYDTLINQTEKQLALLGELLERFERSDDEAERARLLAHMIVVGVYLKRRDNLILLGEQSRSISARELALCFDETVDNLNLAGIDASCYMSVAGSLPLSVATGIYDFYETVAETAYDGLRTMLIRVYENEGEYAISIDAECDDDLSGLSGEAVTFSSADGSRCMTLRLPKGGAAI